MSLWGRGMSYQPRLPPHNVHEAHVQRELVHRLVRHEVVRLVRRQVVDARDGRVAERLAPEGVLRRRRRGARDDVPRDF